MADDPFDLERFVKAQAGVIDVALAELRSGRKRTHWMWFVFPQLKELGFSPMAQFYGLSGRDEACAYVRHDRLGPMLNAALEAVQTSPARTLRELFGSPDDLKFRSSMTLFAAVAPAGPYLAALDRYCAGEPDERTLALLG